MDAPDLPIPEPRPSIAAFPFNFDSASKGKKASSFVASKREYFPALLKQFCKEPKYTVSANGVAPNKVKAKDVSASPENKKMKKPTAITVMTAGVKIAVNVQPRRLTIQENIKPP